MGPSKMRTFYVYKELSLCSCIYTTIYIYIYIYCQSGSQQIRSLITIFVNFLSRKLSSPQIWSPITLYTGACSITSWYESRGIKYSLGYRLKRYRELLAMLLTKPRSVWKVNRFSRTFTYRLISFVNRKIYY